MREFGATYDEGGEPRTGRKRGVWIRRILIGIGALVLLLAIAAVGAKMYFTPERLSSLVVPRLEEAAGREVELSTVRLDLFPRPAVRLEDFALAAAPGFGPEPALTGEALDVQIALLPLLGGQVTVKRLRLVAPTVRYVVAADGSHSFGGLGGDGTEDAEGEGRAVALPASEFAVERGTILYDDRQAGRGARFRADGSFSVSTEGRPPAVFSSEGDLRIGTLRALVPDLREDSLRIESFHLAYDGRLVPEADSLDFHRLDLEIDELSIRGGGALDWSGETPRVAFRFETGETDLEALRRMVPRLDFGELRPRGRVRVTGHVEGPLGDGALPEVEGETRVEGLALGYSGRDQFVSDVEGQLSFTRESANIGGLEGELLGRDFRVEGDVLDFEELRVDLRVEGGGDLERLREVLPDDVAGGAVAGYEPRGDAEFSLRLRGPLGGEGGTLDVTGEARVTDFAAAYPGAGQVIEEADAALAFDGEVVRVSSFQGSVLGRPIQGEGRLERGDPGRIEGRIAGEIDLERLSTLRARLAEASDDPEPEAPRPMSGVADVELAFRGTTDEGLSGLTFEGPIRLSELRYETPSLAAPLRIPTGTVRLRGTDLATEELTLRVGETDLSLTADARGVLPLTQLDPETRSAGARPTLDFRLDSERIVLDQLFPTREAEGEPTYSEVLKAHLSGEAVDGRRPEEVAGDRFPLPSLPRLDAVGEVRVAELVNPPTRMQNLSFRVRLEENRLRVEDVRSGLYGGQLTGQVTAELGGADRRSSVRFDVALEGSDAAAFMDRWTKLQNALTGTLDISIAGGTFFDQTLLPVTEQTNAEGRVTVRDGSVEGMVPMQGIVRAVGISSRELARFDSLGGPFRVREGRLELLDWRLDSQSGANGRAEGSVAFAGPLDLDMTLSVPVAMLEGSPLMQLVGGGRAGGGQGMLSRLLGGGEAAGAEGDGEGGEDRMVDIPLSIRGTMSDPRVGVDERAFAGALQNLLGGGDGGGRGLLRGLLGGGGEEDTTDTDGGGLLDRLMGGSKKDTADGGG